MTTPHGADQDRGGAAADSWPVIVIGGGPAGAAAAITLARAGVRTLLLERQAVAAAADEPRTPDGGKVCGGCLNRAALRELDELGAACGAAVRSRGRTLDRVRICVGGRSVVLPMGGSLAIGRDELDPMLRGSATDAGAEVRLGVTAEIQPGRRNEREPVRVIAGDARAGTMTELEAGVVVAADGLAGTSLRRWTAGQRRRRSDLPGVRIGLGAVLDWPADGKPGLGELVMAAGDGGYLGLTRLSGGRADLAAAVDPAALRRAGGPSAWMTTTLRSAGIDRLPPGLAADEAISQRVRLRGTPRLATASRWAAGDGVLRVGDGLAYAEPFTGEGMAWALAGGRRVAELILAQSDQPAREQAWIRTARGLRRRQLGCRFVAGGLRTGAGRVIVMGAMRVAPPLAAAALHLIGRGPSPTHAPAVTR